MQKSPDMRVFNMTAGSKHEMYDAGLVSAFRGLSAWTQTHFPNAPLTKEQYAEDLRLKYGERIRQLVGTSYDPSNRKSYLQQDLAFRTVRWLGGAMHMQRKSMEEVLPEVFIPLRSIVKSREVVLHEGENHPLFNHQSKHQVRFVGEMGEEGDQQTQWKPALPASKQDIAGAEALLGLQQSGFLEFVRQTQPYIADIDDSYVQTPLLDIRKALISALTDAVLTPELREQLMEQLGEHWESNINFNMLTMLEEELIAETGDPEILQRNCSEILRRCFIEPLQAMQPDDHQTSARLSARKMVLESLYLTVVQSRQWEHVPALIDAFDLYYEHLRGENSNLGYLSLINLIGSTTVPDAEMLTRALL